MKFKWTKIEQDAFDKIKWIVACNNLLYYPYFNKQFKIQTDARIFQLGAVITKKGKPIAFYSIKITGAQKRYTVTEKEMLSTVETLKEIITILIGKILRTYNDHNNITCKFLIPIEC